jgi:RNA polymerase sigma-70 factor (ECF subfamily)
VSHGESAGGPDKVKELTSLIREANGGSDSARERLFRAINDEFRQLAGALIRRERPGHTLCPSDLVNEAMLRMIEAETIDQAPNRRYLYKVAAKVMRQVLVDHARKRSAAKRLGRSVRVPLDEALAYFDDRQLDVLALDEAIDRLMAWSERHGLVVVLRVFAGLSVADTADVLGVSVSTVEGDWRFARAWLHSQLKGADV